MKLKIIAISLAAIALAIVLLYNPKRDPEKAKAYIEQGKSFYNSGKMDDAITAYQNAIDNDPSAESYNYLGMAYRSKYQETRNKSYNRKEISAFKKAIKLDPTQWKFYVNLGTTLFFSRSKRAAVEYFQKALELYPQNPEAADIKNKIDSGLKE